MHTKIIKYLNISQKVYVSYEKKLNLIHARTFCSVPPSDKDDFPLKQKVPDVEKLLRNSSPLKDSLRDETTFATTPYPDGTIFSQFGQARHSLRPPRPAATTSIILFPGQGTQFVGMGKDVIEYPIARDMFKAASSILGYDLLKLCLEGPIEKLNSTKYCQPAVIVCSLAAIEKLKEKEPEAINNCIATAGFSVGEISALVFAGCINFEKAIKTVKARAEAMQYCSDMVPSGMLTVLLGADSELSKACSDARSHCKEKGIEDPVCNVANYLYPAAKVIAGHNEALDYIVQNTKKYHIRRVSRLPVSGAFHTQLMKPAAEAVYSVLKKGLVNDPIISVHRNIDGKRYLNGSTVLSGLTKQVYSPVKWEQTLHILYERPAEVDFPRTYECGPGKSLTTLLMKVNAKAASHAHNILT